MPEYYLRISDDGVSIQEQFWAVEERVAHEGIVPSQLGTHCADPGEGIMVTLGKRFTAGQFHKLRLGPGEYYPRMARPSSTRAECSPGYNPDQSAAARYTRIISTGQLHALIQKLEDICQVVHPIRENFCAYGHEIRNIIILACTEIEAQWKNILKENGNKGESTHDYVKLSLPMKLGEYRVTLPWYPWLKPFVPFRNWVPCKAPSKLLPWYDAYNRIKHDREENFAQAKLINALQAVAGCFVMLCAQYGWDFAKRGESTTDAFFLLIEAPRWEPSEIYVPPYGTTPKKQPYFTFGP